MQNLIDNLIPEPAIQDPIFCRSKRLASYRFKSNVTQFTSQIDGKRWFDIPFAYLPAWEAKSHKVKL